jgi:hypothetical protein
VNFEEYKPEKSPSLNSEKLCFGDCPGLIAVSTTKDFVLVKS